MQALVREGDAGHLAAEKIQAIGFDAVGEDDAVVAHFGDELGEAGR